MTYVSEHTKMVSLEQCKEKAESLNPGFKIQIEEKGRVTWTEILEQVDHDELIYKFTLKFLRRDGYDIGNWKIPEVKKLFRRLYLTTPICVS